MHCSPEGRETLLSVQKILSYGSRLKGPPREQGNKVLISSLTCFRIHALRTATVGLAKGVQRSLRPLP